MMFPGGGVEKKEYKSVKQANFWKRELKIKLKPRIKQVDKK